MNKNVPRLRFKEFSDEWQENKLCDLGSLGRGKSKHRPRNDIKLYGGVYPFVQTGDIKKSNLYLKEYSSTYSEFGLSQSKLWNENTLCITIAANIAETTILGLKACFPDSIIGFISDNYKSNVVFIKNWFDFYKKSVEKISEGVAQSNLNLEKINNIELLVPSLQEQERIANFFTVLDNLIEEQEAKVNDLELYKKGMMQQIFKQKIRFKDENGQDYLAWKEIKLKEILKERKLFSEKNKEYPHVTLSKEGIYEKGERYNRDFLVRTEDKKYKITLKNDICYNPANLKFGVICRNNYGKAIFSPIYITFEVLGCNNEFIEYFVCRTDFINRVRKYEEGTVYERTAVKPEDFLRFSVDLPCLEEQTKIANFLSNIDNLIEEEQKNLNDLKEMKKGLLQQMFV